MSLSTLPPVVYVAAPYTGVTREHTASNVAAARHVGQLCARKGWMPLMPTVNTAHFERDFPDVGSYEFWMAGTESLLRRCDAVIFVDGWENSHGCRCELQVASELGIPRFFSVRELPHADELRELCRYAAA